jgi:hypothetical protein
MGFWDTVMHKKSDDWTYLELTEDQVPDGMGHESIASDSAYVSVTLNSMRVRDVRRGLKKFYGAVHSWSSVAHLGEGRAEFQVVSTPAELKDADPQNIDRVISMDKVLLGPVPYRGGTLDFEIGLFSVASQELVGPFLDMLEGMSKAAGVTFVSAARPFIQPLADGIALLTGTSKDTALEVGLAKQWAPTTGHYVVMRAPKGSVGLGDVQMSQDQKLAYRDGRPVEDFPYVVFSISAARERPNWIEIPELKKSYDDLNAEIRKGKMQDATEAFTAFRRAALTSPDLLLPDAQAISEKVDAYVKQVLEAGQTSGGGKPKELPGLETFSPFVAGT